MDFVDLRRLSMEEGRKEVSRSPPHLAEMVGRTARNFSMWPCARLCEINLAKDGGAAPARHLESISRPEREARKSQTTKVGSNFVPG